MLSTFGLVAFYALGRAESALLYAVLRLFVKYMQARLAGLCRCRRALPFVRPLVLSSVHCT